MYKLVLNANRNIVFDQLGIELNPYSPSLIISDEDYDMLDLNSLVERKIVSVTKVSESENSVKVEQDTVSDVPSDTEEEKPAEQESKESKEETTVEEVPVEKTEEPVETVVEEQTETAETTEIVETAETIVEEEKAESAEEKAEEITVMAKPKKTAKSKGRPKKK